MNVLYYATMLVLAVPLTILWYRVWRRGFSATWMELVAACVIYLLLSLLAALHQRYEAAPKPENLHEAGHEVTT